MNARLKWFVCILCLLMLWFLFYEYCWKSYKDLRNINVVCLDMADEILLASVEGLRIEGWGATTIRGMAASDRIVAEDARLLGQAGLSVVLHLDHLRGSSGPQEFIEIYRGRHKVGAVKTITGLETYDGFDNWPAPASPEARP